jgi:hypothetical protein
MADDDLLSRIDAAITEATACGCGCGTQITEKSHSTWFASAACQVKWHRERNGALPDWSTSIELSDGPRPPVVAIPAVFSARARVTPQPVSCRTCREEFPTAAALELHAPTCGIRSAWCA